MYRLLAESYAAAGKLTTARKAAEQSRQMSVESGAILEVARVDMIFAKLAVCAGQLDSAIDKLHQARHLFLRSCVCVCARARACACVCVCVCVCI